MKNTSNAVHKSIVVIFIIQLSLLMIMSLIFLLGVKRMLTIEDFWFAIIMGSLGASVGLQRKIKSNSIEAITGLRQYLTLVFTPILYGTIMAGITYLIFMSHILSGDGGGGLITTNIFPNFSDIPNPESVKLISTTEIIGLIDSTGTINTKDLMDFIALKNSVSETLASPDDLNVMERFMNTRTNTIKDTGKLLVWCFIAGYSEKFITGILGNIESRAVND